MLLKVILKVKFLQLHQHDVNNFKEKYLKLVLYNGLDSSSVNIYNMQELVAENIKERFQG